MKDRPRYQVEPVRGGWRPYTTAWEYSRSPEGWDQRVLYLTDHAFPRYGDAIQYCLSLADGVEDRSETEDGYGR